MKKEYADFLTEKTKKDYDAIATDFDRTRSYLWSDLKRFASLIPAGSRVLDFGCGNGRLLEAFAGKDIRYVGIDQSQALIDAAGRNHEASVARGKAQFVVSHGDALPFPDASFDAVFCVAVLHHIPSRAKREALLAEWKRVLKPDGVLFASVWNLWQKKYLALIAKHMLGKALGQSNLDWKDILVPWKDAAGASRAERYYHCFTAGELSSLIRRAGFRKKESGAFGGPRNRFNLYIFAKK